MSRAGRPNVVYVFADEWRAQATGYAGDPNCETPVLDGLAAESVDATAAVAGCPVCCPYRASLMTGQYPLRHGVFVNDVGIDPGCASLPRTFAARGYRTAFIGKWHIHGSPDGAYGGRAVPVPRAHQLGFERWMGFECTHNYHESPYYVDDDPTRRIWEGYDAFAQSRAAADHIRAHADGEDPFLLVLGWGPPHFPLHTAPEEYRARYADRDIELRPNIPAAHREKAAEELRGYYAHIAACDDALKIVLDALREAGCEDDTILVFTADHGDMRQCQGLDTKLFPFEESVRVPFLLRWPRALGREPRKLPIPIDAPDVLPTLADLCGIAHPGTVEGRSFAPELRGERAADPDDAALLVMAAEYTELRFTDMRAYRGLRSSRRCYVRDTRGPWLHYDMETDPYQQRNLIDDPAHAAERERLEAELRARLAHLGDPFLTGEEHLRRAGLQHYREVELPVRRPWRDPWR